ncbi:hypothetical protein HZS_3515, partial [Henneguya salminicola]
MRIIDCNANKQSTDSESYSCKYGTAEYYGLCGIAGILSCGLTHTMVVPLDVIKCRVQVNIKISKLTNSQKYKGLFSGLKVTINEEGGRALFKGWAPTLIGYSLQGLGKFGLYEVFKHQYAKILGEEYSYTYRTSLYIAASASAEFFADIMLCPMEAIKVRIQTQSEFADTLRRGVPKLYAGEGFRGFFKCITPLWCRQIPYTIMKFASFERVLEFMYKNILKKPRDNCAKSEQLAITLLSGYIAGVFCAVVSHPADVVVSKLNKQKGSSASKIFKSLGFKGIWSGLTTRIIMVGTLTALQ